MDVRGDVLTYGGNGAWAVGDGKGPRLLGRVALVLPGDDGGLRAVGHERVHHDGGGDGSVHGRGRRDARLGGSPRGREKREEGSHLHLVFLSVRIVFCSLFYVCLL